MFSRRQSKPEHSVGLPPTPVLSTDPPVDAPSRGNLGIRKLWNVNKVTNSSHTHDHICSSAQSICHIILGQKSTNSVDSGLSIPANQAAITTTEDKENGGGARMRNMRRKGEMEVKPVPVVSRKAFRKLKGELVKPVEARRIIIDLKRMDTQEMGNQAPAQGAKRWIMPLLDDRPNPSLSAMSTTAPPSITVTAPSTISPAFSTVLATANGVISNLSSNSASLNAAFDHPTIFICASPPPPSIR